MPSLIRRCEISGFFTKAVTSARIVLTIGSGVCAGAKNPFHEENSNPGSVSATVGMSGAAGLRCAVPTAIRPCGCGKQPLPAERPKEEAGQVGRPRSDHKLDLRAGEGPTRARDSARDEEGCGKRHDRVQDRHRAPKSRHALGTTNSPTVRYWQTTATTTSKWKISW